MIAIRIWDPLSESRTDADSRDFVARNIDLYMDCHNHQIIGWTASRR
jgi:hypothetical protein